MSTNGETADLMVREGIQITESALKLAGLGAKNLAAWLIALANDNQKLAGKTNLKRLMRILPATMLIYVWRKNWCVCVKILSLFWGKKKSSRNSPEQCIWKMPAP